MQHHSRKVSHGTNLPPHFWDCEEPSPIMGPQSPSNTEKGVNSQSATTRRATHKRQRSQQLGPIASTMHMQPKHASSRNQELVQAQTQRTPKKHPSDDGETNQLTEGVVQTPRKHHQTGPGKQSVTGAYPQQPCGRTKTRKVANSGNNMRSSKQSAASGHQGRQSNLHYQQYQPHGMKVDAMSIRESNLQSSEKKVSKYDHMLHSLEAAAVKQRTTPGTNCSAKKMIVSTTDATEPLHQETRTAALSISSGISKNTGTGTVIAHERLAQLQAYQRYQQQCMQGSQQLIFDRNRPWNCEYCLPRSAPLQFVDQRVWAFSRKNVANIVSRFMIKEEFYESRKVVELLNTNSRSVLVAQFKDYLIYDDIYEFLTSLYNLSTSLDILTRHAVFYASLTQLEVLSQYREDQIRDRHLVLHGLKPCYVGLEKQIQAIIASNLRNKLRLILTKVKKVQISRGLRFEEPDFQETASSQFSTPVRQGEPSGKRGKTGNQKTFKKLIQSSMVREYNFSRSQSGLLIGCDQQQSVEVPFRPETGLSINFTSISFDREVEICKGSDFDESVARHDLQSPTENWSSQIQQEVENIESMYMNAQLILDDLSSRPLTRQSMPQPNRAASPSRIHMYNLQQHEEHKMRVPFILAPEKPDTQQSCADNSGSMLLFAAEEAITIDNQGDFMPLLSQAPGLSQIEHRQQLVAQSQRIGLGASIEFLPGPERGHIDFEPFALPKDDHSLGQSIHSYDTYERSPRGAKISSQPLDLQGVPKQAQLVSRKGHSKNMESSVGSMKHSIQKPRDGKVAQPNSIQKPSGKALKAIPNELRVHEERKLTLSLPQANHASKYVSGKASLCRNQVPASLAKASPALSKNFGPSKVFSQRVLSMAQPQSKASHLLGKKASSQTATGASNYQSSNLRQAASIQQEEIEQEESQRKGNQFSSQSRYAEDREKIKVSKKLIASIKKNISSPCKPVLQLERGQVAVNEQAFTQQHSSPQLAASRQLHNKVLTPAKALGNFTVKTLSTVQHQHQQAFLRPTPAKMIKASSSTTKRADEKVKAAGGGNSSRKQIMCGSAPNVFNNNEKASFLIQLGNDQKKNQQKNQLSLKEQVLLEALRREQSGLIPEGHRTLSGAASQQFASFGGQTGGIRGLEHEHQFDQQALKLLKSQHLTNSATAAGLIAQPKSVISQKVDLFTIAGKLKLLNQPNKTPTASASTVFGKGGQRARMIGSKNRRNSLKFNSRKGSVEQAEFEAIADSYNTADLEPKSKRDHIRVISKDRPLRTEEAAAQTKKDQHQTTGKQEPEKVQKRQSSKRKLVVANSHVEPYYTQRSGQTVIKQSKHALQPLLPTPSSQPRNQSRNLVSMEQRETSAAHKQINTAGSKTSFQDVLKPARAQKAAVQAKKKIAKLSRAYAGATLSPQGQSEGSIPGTSFVSPRQLVKEVRGDQKTAKTASKNTILHASINNLPQGRKLQFQQLNSGTGANVKQESGPALVAVQSQQQQITPRQTLTRQSQIPCSASYFESAMGTNNYQQTSRNGGLQTATTQPLTLKVANALKELSLTPSTKHSLQLKGASTTKALQSHQQLPAATVNQMSMPHVTLKQELKQELKLHSRKNSGALVASRGAATFNTASSTIKKKKKH